MNTRLTIRLGILGWLVCNPGALFAARAVSDLQPPQKRQTTVSTAERLAQRSEPSPLPAELESPFNPPGFDRPDPADTPPVSQNPVAGEPPPPPPPLGDREILEALAAQLNPTGTIQIGDSSRRVMGSKRFAIGTRLIVTYNNQDYELELVSIDRTTFTLRYRGEEITRPIKSVR
jgi:hypothetical protein